MKLSLLKELPPLKPLTITKCIDPSFFFAPIIVGLLLTKLLSNAAEGGLDKLVDESFATAVDNCKFFS